jgi:hypothetical protein
MDIPCICDPKDGDVRHPDGDTVSLKEKLGFHEITAIRWASAVLKEMDPGASTAQFLATTTEQYVLLGVESWRVLDGKGKPVSVTKAEIRARILENDLVGQLVGDEADKYYGAVMRPLLNPVWTSSPPTPTAGSTSLPTDSSRKSPKPSKQSSITTIPTASTETTSTAPGGDSSLSPSSTSAA